MDLVFEKGGGDVVALQKHKSFERAMLAAAPGTQGLGIHWLGRKCCLFRFSFVLGPAKEFKLKTSRVSSPTHQKHFVWCHVRGNVRDYWGKKGWGNIGLGGSAVFLHSLCAWASKGI